MPLVEVFGIPYTHRDDFLALGFDKVAGSLVADGSSVGIYRLRSLMFSRKCRVRRISHADGARAIGDCKWMR